jgi:hypothetical protein
MSETFSVGDSVTVVRNDRRLVRIAVIATAGKRKLALDDGSEWAADGGRAWGRAGDRWYMGPWIRRTEEGDAEEIRRRALLDKITDSKGWYKLSTEVLETVVRLIEEAKCTTS